jgi:hypothetical protein
VGHVAHLWSSTKNGRTAKSVDVIWDFEQRDFSWKHGKEK